MGDQGLAEKVLNGDERSAGRLISLIEKGDSRGYEELAALIPHTGDAQIIGITGPPGAGKSTITGRLAAALSQKGRRVGVVATDPTSIRGGGALLGDRLRMKDAEEQGIFIRSMAHRGYPGGVARAAAGALYVLEALGKDVLLVESIGAGQGEKELFYLCDTVTILFTPDYGDEMQLLKAGLIEIGDIMVVNKSDHPGAEEAAHDLARYCSGRTAAEEWIPPVLLTRANHGEGVAELLEAIERHWVFITREGGRKKKKEEKISAFMMSLLKEEAWKRFALFIADDEECTRIAEDAKRGKIDPYSAVEKILERTGVRNSKGN